MSHTKGPWKVIRDKCGLWVRDKGLMICSMRDICRFPDQNERYEREKREVTANANLIAAAPEMLELLERADKLIPLFGGSSTADAWKADYEKLMAKIKEEA